MRQRNLWRARARSQWVAGLGWLVLVTGCAEPRIDASSPESFERSTRAIRSHLSDRDEGRFEASVKVILLAEMGPAIRAELDRSGSSLAVSDSDRLRMLGRLLKPLDGLTARQVIAKGDSIRAAKGAAYPFPLLPNLFDEALDSAGITKGTEPQR